MAVLAGEYVTLADWAKRTDPDGKIADIIEMLHQTNEILMDMLFTEGNLPTGHRTTMRTGLPRIFWRLLNMGIPSSKSTSAQVDEACGMMEAYSDVDVALAQLNGNTGKFRLSEAEAYIEGMNQEMASTLFYGNSSVSPEEFNGLSIRYSDSTAPNGKNIVKAGGAGSDNTSAWFIVWGKNTVHGIYPKGSTAGLTQKDKGEVTSENVGGVAGNKMEVFREHYSWRVGLALKDWRFVVRVCNIDVSNLVSDSSPADITKFLIKGYHRIKSFKAGKPALYMNRTLFQYLDLQRYTNVKAATITYREIDGVAVPFFRGIPIRICDAILDTEATVA